MALVRTPGRTYFEPLEAGRFRRLPEPVRLEDTVTSEDVTVVAPEGDESLRENAWMLRTAGLP